MAVHTFWRGWFARWGIPMWEGETRAFKLLRLLRKQGITGVLYEEGPLVPYTVMDVARPIRYYGHALEAGWHKGPCPTGLAYDSMAPAWFKVSFGKDGKHATKTNSEQLP